MSNDKDNAYVVSFGSWMFIQCGLLVIHFGFDKTLPQWVLWFPAIVSAGILFVVLVIVMVMLFWSWI